MNGCVQTLRQLAKDCTFKAVSAKNEEEHIRDAFISGLYDGDIRKRLLENTAVDLETVVNQARLLDHARKSSEFYSTKQLPFGNTTAAATAGADTRSPDLCAAATDNQKQLCFFCGNSRHPRANCPARDRNCHKCGRRGHLGTVCKSKLPVKTTASTLPDEKPTSSASAWISVTSSTCATVKSMTSVTINGITAKALVDIGSTGSFICRRLADRMQLKVIRAVGIV